MKSTPRRSDKNQEQKHARPSPKRKEAPVRGSDHTTSPQASPSNAADAGRLRPQVEADALRDKRLVKDLQDNANRSDLTKHRREISATKEDHEDADEDEEEELQHIEQEAEPALSDVSDTSKNLDP